MTSYLMTPVTIALSFTIYEIITNQIKCQKFDLENEGRGQVVEKRDLCRSTEYVRILIDGLFQNVSYLGTYIYAKWLHKHTHIHTHIHRERPSDF